MDQDGLQYFASKNWINLKTLRIGDLCINADWNKKIGYEGIRYL